MHSIAKARATWSSAEAREAEGTCAEQKREPARPRLDRNLLVDAMLIAAKDMPCVARV
jgi:hypothetical protein